MMMVVAVVMMVMMVMKVMMMMVMMMGVMMMIMAMMTMIMMMIMMMMLIITRHRYPIASPHYPLKPNASHAMRLASRICIAPACARRCFTECSLEPRLLGDIYRESFGPRVYLCDACAVPFSGRHN
jgi:hypothetical protein